MIGQSRPPGRRLWSLCVWSLVIGLAWLLLGQQYTGQPAVHLDLTAGLPGAATVHQQPVAPASPVPAPPWQLSPRSSPPHSMGTSPPQQHSPGTSTGSSQAV